MGAGQNNINPQTAAYWNNMKNQYMIMVMNQMTNSNQINSNQNWGNPMQNFVNAGNNNCNNMKMMNCQNGGFPNQSNLCFNSGQNCSPMMNNFMNQQKSANGFNNNNNNFNNNFNNCNNNFNNCNNNFNNFNNNFNNCNNNFNNCNNNFNNCNNNFNNFNNNFNNCNNNFNNFNNNFNNCNPQQNNFQNSNFFMNNNVNQCMSNNRYNNCNNINMNASNMACSMNNMPTQNNCSNQSSINVDQLTHSMNNLHINEQITSSTISNEMHLRFTLMGGHTFKVSVNPNEKLINVFNKFKETQCPEQYKNRISHILSNGEVLNYNKTILENNLKENDNCIIITNKSDGSMTDENLENTDTNELGDEEKEQLKKWIIEYKSKKLIDFFANIIENCDKEDAKDNTEKDKQDLSKILSGELTMINFMNFIKQKEHKTGIKLADHEHILVMCLTNYDWKCEKCNKNYDKKVSKYYCSVCDYCICEDCIDQNSNTLKKSLNKQNLANSLINMTQKFYETDYHEHRLIYCRTSRSSLSLNGWICDNCRREFKNNVWSFYCTLCDFDLCSNCMGIHE